MPGFLKSVYGMKTEEDIRRLYADWSRSYDREVGEAGYVTPTRVATALRAAGADPEARLLDFGCGTGISGMALAAAGFRAIDGVDLSPEMLDKAADKRIYTNLRVIGATDPVPNGYPAIAAIGVIGPGAAPLGLLDRLVEALAPGALLGFSFNDHALADPAFPARVAALAGAGTVAELFAEHGPHLPAIGIGATVYILQKQ